MVLREREECDAVVLQVFCFKQKTAYEMRISDWSSDVCSSDLGVLFFLSALLTGDLRRWLGEDAARALERAGPLAGKLDDDFQIGRASCRERVCQYVSISVVAVSLKKKAN